MGQGFTASEDQKQYILRWPMLSVSLFVVANILQVLQPAAMLQLYFISPCI